MGGSPAGRGGVVGERILVLGAGPAQLGLLRAARARGLYVIACDRNPSAVGFEYADRRAVVSVENEEAIGRLARAENVDGIVAPGVDWPVAIAARVAEQLRLPHAVTPETATLANTKHRQRERLAEHGIAQPAWETTAGGPVELGVPCVVKPVDRQGQKGVSAVRDLELLDEAVSRALEESRTGLALVEELVEGPEVTVNAFSAGGRFYPLTVTDRITADEPAFGVALAHAWPSEHPVDEAVELARRAAEAVGVEDGPTYTQLRLGPDGPRVIELAARLGGGNDGELCRVALGVDLNALALAAALGEPVEAPEPSPAAGGACVSFLVALPGVLAGTDGIEEALAVEGVLDVRLFRPPGWEFGPLRKGSDRAGFVLARGDSRDDALARAGRAMERVRFVTADERALV